MTLTPGASLVVQHQPADAGRDSATGADCRAHGTGQCPAEGSFRPPYCGPLAGARFNKSQLDYSLLQKFAPVAGTPAWSDLEAQFAAPWIEHAGGWTATALRPKLNMPNYGVDIHNSVGRAALLLHTNAPDTQKEKLCIALVQYGIDLYAIATNGGNGNWVGEGGQGGGRKWPILLAGLLLHDDAMKSIGAKSGDYLYQNGHSAGNVPPDYIAFGEDDQTFYVAQSDVDVTHGSTWAPDSRDTTKTPYDPSDIGLPEWGITHSRWPYTSNKWWGTEYRAVACPPFPATALAALLMGEKGLWNHLAYFDYCDRYMRIVQAAWATDPAAQAWAAQDFAVQMWRTYRDQCGAIWPAANVVPGPVAPKPALGPVVVTVPVYRFVRKISSAEHLTADPADIANLSRQTAVWVNQGIAFYAWPGK